MSQLSKMTNFAMIQSQSLGQDKQFFIFDSTEFSYSETKQYTYRNIKYYNEP